MRSLHESRELYRRMTHAMQSGVAMEQELDKNGPGAQSDERTTKFLRVGINTAMCDHAALVKLLISKGIITDPEYLDAIATEMTEEVKRYERRLSERMDADITLA